MDTHRIDVFDRTDDDGIVGAVAHHLHLVFLPAQKAFVDQHLCHGRGVKPRAHDAFIIVAVIGHAAARAAQRIGRADDRGQADIRQRLDRLGDAGGDVVSAICQFRGGDDRGTRIFQPDPVHRLAEQLAVLGHFDGRTLRADQFDPVAVQRAAIGQRQRGVQPGLPAHRRQQRIGPFLGDDLFDHGRRDRFDIGRIGHFRIGHDRGGIGVDQDHAITFLAQRLAGLGAGIVEFAGLTNDDGPGPDDQDRLDIGSFRHASLRAVWDRRKSSGVIAKRVSCARARGGLGRRRDRLADAKGCRAPSVRVDQSRAFGDASSQEPAKCAEERRVSKGRIRRQDVRSVSAVL